MRRNNGDGSPLDVGDGGEQKKRKNVVHTVPVIRIIRLLYPVSTAVSLVPGLDNSTAAVPDLRIAVLALVLPLARGTSVYTLRRDRV